MATIETKWFSSAMGAAPPNSGTPGTLIGVLDAFLVNGFGTVTLDSLVVSNNVATLAKSAGHGFLDQQVIEISGATPSSLNGQWRFSKISTTAGTFAANGISDQTATGTITAKTPPLGWTKPFSGTNKAAYKQGSPSATGSYLRVDDSVASNAARVRGYVTMSALDVGTDPFPTDAQVSGGGYWAKSNTASAAVRDWAAVGDGARFYLMMSWLAPGADSYQAFFFGDIKTFVPGDAYCAAIICSTATNAGSYLATIDGGSSSRNMWIARNHLGASGAINAARYGNWIAAGSGNSPWTYPSPLNNGLFLLAPVLVGQVSGELRGWMPGFMQILNNAQASLAANTVLSSVAGISGPVFVAQDKPSGSYLFGLTLSGLS